MGIVSLSLALFPAFIHCILFIFVLFFISVFVFLCCVSPFTSYMGGDGLGGWFFWVTSSSLGIYIYRYIYIGIYIWGYIYRYIYMGIFVYYEDLGYLFSHNALYEERHFLSKN